MDGIGRGGSAELFEAESGTGREGENAGVFAEVEIDLAVAGCASFVALAEGLSDLSGLPGTAATADFGLAADTLDGGAGCPLHGDFGRLAAEQEENGEADDCSHIKILAGME